MKQGGPLERRTPMPKRRKRPRRTQAEIERDSEYRYEMHVDHVETEARVIVYTRACLPGERTARCEWCGVPVGLITDVSWHHRLPRQMGGDDRSVWHPSRLLLLCGSGTTGCHGRAESLRKRAEELGLIVFRGPLREDPAETCRRHPFLLRGGIAPVDPLTQPAHTVIEAAKQGGWGRWVELTPAGQYGEVAA